MLISLKLQKAVLLSLDPSQPQPVHEYINYTVQESTPTMWALLLLSVKFSLASLPSLPEALLEEKELLNINK